MTQSDISDVILKIFEIVTDNKLDNILIDIKKSRRDIMPYL